MSTKALLLLALLTTTSSCAHQTVSAASQPSTPEDISFLSIIVDTDTAMADTRLKRFLEKAVSEGKVSTPGHRALRFQQQTMPYGDVIRAFAEPDPSRGYLARITPYAYVAAELLGAKLNILAVYRSVATKSTTYHAYFVVRKDAFRSRTDWKSESNDPGIDDVVEYLKSFERQRTPAKFYYHDRFSTSSYFLPSLYFRKHDVFAMGQSLNPHLTPIQVIKLPSTSSGDLVHEVLDRKADLVAVWDGTKDKFKDNRDLLFIPILGTVPNDFLVASGVSEETQQVIIDAIRKDPAAGRLCTEIKDTSAWSVPQGKTPRTPCSEVKDDKIRPTDDFDAWYPWDGSDGDITDAAREALAALRQDARHLPTPVVVRVQARHKGNDRHDRLLDTYVSAAREAVRLSGTEFVLEDMDLHRRVDMTWILESTHDGALTLTSKLDAAFREPDETFAISFVDGSDLPRRIADLVRSRLRRVRYVWPYELKYPAVLRDLDFTPDNRVLVQKISWLDPARNEYEEDTPFTARIENNTDFSKLRLSDEIKFPRNNDGSFAFDPMSNIAYRVVIAREPQASWIWTALPYCFIGLFFAACIGLAIDLRRQQPPPKGLQQTYGHLVREYHRPWRGQELEEGAILMTDPAYMDDSVKELKSAGSFLDMVHAGSFDFDLGPIPLKFSLLMRLGSRVFRLRRLSSDLFESSNGGSVAALDGLIQFLVGSNRLSPFIGFPETGTDGGRATAWPIEWEALNEIASRHFQRLGICDKAIDANLGGASGPLAATVATHFRAVIGKAKRDISLFRQTWRTGDASAPGRLVHEGDLRAPLMWRGPEGSALVARVRLEVVLPPAQQPFSSSDATLAAWVFGKLQNPRVDRDSLVLEVRPIAVMRDYAHQH